MPIAWNFTEKSKKRPFGWIFLALLVKGNEVS
jgi:hypothetical protein